MRYVELNFELVRASSHHRSTVLTVCSAHMYIYSTRAEIPFTPTHSLNRLYNIKIYVYMV